MVVWHPIEKTRPPESTLLMVTGPSGYSVHPHFLALAENHPLPGLGVRWLGVDGYFLSDVDFHPTHWAYRIALPSDQVVARCLRTIDMFGGK